MSDDIRIDGSDAAAVIAAERALAEALATAREHAEHPVSAPVPEPAPEPLPETDDEPAPYREHGRNGADSGVRS